MADKEMNAEINVEFEEAATRQSLNSGDSVNTLFGKIKKFFSDLKPVAFSGDAETVNGHTVESDVPALGYYYATCSSSLTTNIKVVTCEGFEFKEGARITVRFTTNNADTPSSASVFVLKINDDGGRPIAYNDWFGEGILTSIDSKKSEAFCSNQVWDFIFIGGRFIMQAPLRGYQMDTALSDSSSNPVENKVIKAELDKKANTDDIPTSLPANGGNAATVGGVGIASLRQITQTVINTLPDVPNGEGDYFVNRDSSDTSFPYQYGMLSIRYGSYTGEYVAIFRTTGNDNKIYYNTYLSNHWSGWQEISATPIKSTQISGTTGETGNVQLWATTDKRIPIAALITDRYGYIFTSSNGYYYVGIYHPDNHIFPTSETVNGVIYYIEPAEVKIS